ncbi:MAG: EF-P lysine aminoacylase EpmA [Spiribacter sp.]|jgi:lysyl-tRNA synthetase class 2|nr:EF-P lysine aminoacylase EpmA [Spiribacter sp.]
MAPADWLPSATPAVLRQRAALLSQLRAFFAARDVIEVQTPVLAGAGVTDPKIEQFYEAKTQRWLQTSPEYAMKRLLAAGIGDCFQITPVFRAGEQGRYHNPEFTLLEWYRCGFDAETLMQEVTELVNAVLGEAPFVHQRYQQAFIDAGLPDPLTADQTQLQQAALATAKSTALPDALEREGWLDWLLSTVVIQSLPARCFLTHYPANQAVLARLSPTDARVAERFELFCDGVEIANGFHELTDPQLLNERFARDQVERQTKGQMTLHEDTRLLAAMTSGLPDCAGVALGVDRLFMLAAGLDSIANGIAFDWDRA